MPLDIRSLAKAFNRVDTIVTQPVTRWLLQHGDEPLPPDIADIIRRLLTTPPRNRVGSFSASSAGQCERRQVLAFLGVEGLDNIDAQLQNIFNDGKWRHLRWQAMGLAAGILTDIEDPLDWPRMRSKGSMDGSGVVPDDHPKHHWRGKEFGFELKGRSTFQFAKNVGDGPLEEHLDQVARYFLSSGFDLFSIMYEDKTLQSFHEWVIEAEDPDMQRRIENERKELNRLNNSVDNQRLPDKLPECAQARGQVFRECPYGRSQHAACWKSGNWPRLTTSSRRKKP